METRTTEESTKKSQMKTAAAQSNINGTASTHKDNRRKRSSRTNASSSSTNTAALDKLLKYGFHKNHCREALRIKKNNIEWAYQLLMTKYFSYNRPEPAEVPENLQELRLQELNSIRSVHGRNFEEKIPNQVWIIHLELPYLADVYLAKAQPPSNKPTRLCRYFALRKPCFYGVHCNLSHAKPPQEPAIDAKRDKFDLEVHFPAGCKYPLGMAMVSLTAQSEFFPPSASLMVTSMLVDVTQRSTGPCILYLANFLKDYPGWIVEKIQRPRVLYNPYKSLMPQDYATLMKEKAIKEEDLRNADGSAIRPRKQLIQIDATTHENDARIAQRFRKLRRNRKFHRLQGLLDHDQRREINQMVATYRVTIITGGVGYGKTTQIPQIILDDWLINRTSDHVEIISTQPTVLSAMRAAKSVASDRLDRVGELVGYQVLSENRSNSKTRLLYCTTDILLRRLVSDPKLRSVSHVIVDEIQERSAASDLLLLLLKDLLSVRIDLKILLISGKQNVTLFVQYFAGASVFHLGGVGPKPVQQFFLEDAIEMSAAVLCRDPDSEHRRRELDMYTKLDSDVRMDDLRLIGNQTPDEVLPLKDFYFRYKDYSLETVRTLGQMHSDKVDFDMISWLLGYIAVGNHNFPRSGNILVFLPGLDEIVEMHEKLTEKNCFIANSEEFVVISILLGMTDEELAQVVSERRPDVRKIFLSTSIAETSFSVDFCGFVIDCGKTKVKVFDDSKNMESLEVTWVSRENAELRLRRAGGVCFHLFTRHRYERRLEPLSIPEIRHVPLEQIIFSIKTLPALSNKDLKDVIVDLIEPPPEVNLMAAVQRLRIAGAMDADGNLTPLGKHLARLPVDVKIGKIILFGAMFSALDSALTIAASLSTHSPFRCPPNRRFLSNEKKQEFATGYSDHLSILHAYEMFQSAFARSGLEGAWIFSWDNYVSMKTFQKMADLKCYYLRLLMTSGFIPRNPLLSQNKVAAGLDRILQFTRMDLNLNGSNQKVLSAIVCAAFYPNVVKALSPDDISRGAGASAQSRTTDLVYRTRTDENVVVHRKSVNYNVCSYPSPYLAFHEKVNTLLRDCTMVSVLPLALFSPGPIEVEQLASGEIVLALDDGWIRFTVQSNKEAELVVSLKKELLALLKQKADHPKMDFKTHPQGKQLIETLIRLISHERDELMSVPIL